MAIVPSGVTLSYKCSTTHIGLSAFVGVVDVAAFVASRLFFTRYRIKVCLTNRRGHVSFSRGHGPELG